MNPTSEPEQLSADNAPNSAAGRNPSPWPMRLAIVAAVIGALCVSGLFVAYRTYDNATKPDRSSPDVVVDNYLRALLDHRDDAEASQYACADQSGLQPLLALRDDLDQRAKTFSVSITVNWQVGEVHEASESSADVTTTLVVVAASSKTLQEPQSWLFSVRRDSDWRVCSAVRLPAAPSPSLSP